MGFIDGPWSQATEDITGVAKRISEGELRNRTVEQPVASFMPPIQDELVKTIWFIPQERVFDRNAERVIDVSVPQIPKHCIEVGKVVLQERVATTHTEAKQIIDMPVPQISEKTVEVETMIEAEENAPVEVKDWTDVRMTTKKAYCIKGCGQTEERVQSYTVEQPVVAPAPQRKEELLKL